MPCAHLYATDPLMNMNRRSCPLSTTYLPRESQEYTLVDLSLLKTTNECHVRTCVRCDLSSIQYKHIRLFVHPGNDTRDMTSRSTEISRKIYTVRFWKVDSAGEKGHTFWDSYIAKFTFLNYLNYFFLCNSWFSERAHGMV